jgi:hypothetical protein
MNFVSFLERLLLYGANRSISRAERSWIAQRRLNQMAEQSRADFKTWDQWAAAHPNHPLVAEFEEACQKLNAKRAEKAAILLSNAVRRASQVIDPPPPANPSAVAAAQKLHQKGTELYELIQQLCALCPISNDGTNPVAQASAEEKCELGIELSNQILAILEEFALQYPGEPVEHALKYFRSYQKFVRALMAEHNEENEAIAEKAAAEFNEFGSLDCQPLSQHLVDSQAIVLANPIKELDAAPVKPARRWPFRLIFGALFSGAYIVWVLGIIGSCSKRW